ncbi:MAG: 50S ribosomal protein L4 [SAR202 cluster bacterium Casp-Chloro-G4]|nr:50S ribosomal protein L4 [Chloroflexota bacterium]MDA1228265.1 50S ribosomal protein L4 [Chloroflexota bacterium]PKB61367.1 MAG: 50S ribosomal protein L4 [SAR202 cluster bacterium Casp-Chloro-G4]
MKLELRNITGAVVGSVEVRDDVFGAPMNAALVHQVIVGQLANRRQGTAKVKTRAEVSGGGAKPRPQKGSGRSRQGSIRSPQWKGGGVAFGPSPRSYRQRTPKRMKRESLRIALSDKVRGRQLVVVEKLELEEMKTREMAKVLIGLNATSSVLLVGDGADPEIIRTARNIPRVKTLPVDLLNTVDLINARRVVMTLEAVYKAEQLWGGDFVRKRVAAVEVGLDAEPGEDESGDN